jgi:hypothetical protein
LFFLSSSKPLSLSPPAEQTQPENEFIPQIEMVFVFYTYISPPSFRACVCVFHCHDIISTVELISRVRLWRRKFEITPGVAALVVDVLTAVNVVAVVVGYTVPRKFPCGKSRRADLWSFVWITWKRAKKKGRD